ncbi:GNAT family N-acetyltransferase [Heliobacterium mobile]|nr:GNAT family N-acetyltransferase [Heliobacterium mobile]
MTNELKVPRSSRKLTTERGMVQIHGPIPAGEIKQFEMDEGLCAFRPPKEQKEALLEIADLPKGLIFLATWNDRIVGYITIHPPEEFARWAKSQVPGMLEMGAIEVSRHWRGMSISSNLLEVAFSEDFFDESIIIATEYYWHWDLKGKGFSVWEYQRFLEQHFGRVDFKRIGTDEPDILAHPANMLMVRIGKKVPQDRLLLFEESLYQNRWMF